MQLTNEMVRRMWRDIFRKGQGKEALKGPAALPSRQERRAIMQAVEDSWVANRPALKAAMDEAAGRTLTAAEAKVYGRAWLRLMAERGG